MWDKEHSNEWGCPTCPEKFASLESRQAHVCANYGLLDLTLPNEIYVGGIRVDAGVSLRRVAEIIQRYQRPTPPGEPAF